MGIRGLFQYIDEYLDCVDKHKLKKCNVVIDGKNLAYYLHGECTGINVAFGGDFDKYASYVRKFFEGLRTCGVMALVVMDGGQALNGKKIKTAQERAENQILRCLSVNPENQFAKKVFPPICLQVFVTTLHSMGVLVLQTDYEADDDIASLARGLDCTVISEDTDFYMTNVDFVRLSSISYKSISEKNFMPCQHFNIEEFCENTGVNKLHLPLLGTLMGNDYLQKEDLADFHRRVAAEMQHVKRKKIGVGRGLTIKYVLDWMARRSEKTTEQIIKEAVGRNSSLRKKVEQSVGGYTLQQSNLMDCIPYIASPKETTTKGEELLESLSSNKEYTFDTTSPKVLETSSDIRTSLVLKDGETPPAWFVKAYRENKIPHEVADILTQGYFFSPAQVECIFKPSSYLVVEPIVRLVYTFLWKGCKPKEEEKERLADKFTSLSLNAGCTGDPSEAESGANHTSNPSKTDSSSSSRNANTGSHRSESEKNEQVLSWYIRKNDKLWCRHVKFLKGKVVDELPSLKDIEIMSCNERKSAFYKMLQMKHLSKNTEYPSDLELICSMVIYWFKNTKAKLTECHAQTVLVSFFLFNIIDCRIGWLRAWKDFDTVDACKEKIDLLLKDSSYTKSDMNEKDLLASITHEECLAAGSFLFRYHHIDQTMSRKKYKRDVVHSFSEYQACVYFLQLLNSLLCSPFPFLSIEFLWGGTFGYNLFVELSGSSNRVECVKEMFGEGTCLERLFRLVYGKLDSILKFSKPAVNKTDRFNSRKFTDDRERMEERRKIKLQSEEKKVKVKDKVDYDLGDNRFTMLASDSD